MRNSGCFFRCSITLSGIFTSQFSQSPNQYCQFQLLHNSRIINSTSFDFARHWFRRRPDPCFQAQYTPAHSSGETKGSGEGASLPQNRALVSFAVLISPDRRGCLLMRVLGLVLSARYSCSHPCIRTVRLTDVYECYDGLAKDVRKCQHRADFERD